MTAFKCETNVNVTETFTFDINGTKTVVHGRENLTAAQRELLRRTDNIHREAHGVFELLRDWVK